MTATTTRLRTALERHRQRFHPVIPIGPREKVAVLDLGWTGGAEEIDPADVEAFSAWVEHRIRGTGARFGVGRYGEDRSIYRHSPLFEGEEARSVHLGVDLFAPAGTEVRTPLDGTILGAADNRGVGDYGPTVILSHRLDDIPFHTLYGHLSRTDLEHIEPGHGLAAGDVVGHMGTPGENGGWPPHVHFQIIALELDTVTDYPGVARPSDRGRFLELCPDPNLLLRLPELG